MSGSAHEVAGQVPRVQTPVPGHLRSCETWQGDLQANEPPFPLSRLDSAATQGRTCWRVLEEECTCCALGKIALAA
jgi:hypothetical protein